MPSSFVPGSHRYVGTYRLVRGGGNVGYNQDCLDGRPMRRSEQQSVWSTPTNEISFSKLSINELFDDVRGSILAARLYAENYALETVVSFGKIQKTHVLVLLVANRELRVHERKVYERR